MTGKQYQAAIKAVGLSKSASGEFFGYSERQGFRWLIEGPPPAVAKMLRLMSALEMSADDVDSAIEKARKGK